ncbi:MAG: hypothetical protein CL928_11980, partial [Deltaproteobacteria bacterium]|nr:hypothetical protein [Deltaproteobacteria bacterium]
MASGQGGAAVTPEHPSGARLLVGALTALVLSAVVGCAATPVRDPSALPDFAVQLATEDGWGLSLFHLPPNPAMAGEAHYGTPLLLAHGTAVNRMNFMLEGSSLAAYLAEAGFDVWLPELRGDRSSTAPSPQVWRRGDWTVDEMIDHDIPAVLDHILAHTGRSQVYWVGHSLGGILGYATLQGPRASQVAGLVAFGSPGGYTHPNRAALQTQALRLLLPRLGQVPTRPLAKLVKPFVHLAPDSPLLHLVYNLDNSDPEHLSQFIRPAMENIGTGVVKQYALWVEGGDLRSVDGQRDYTAGLAKVVAPVLLFAGRVDHIVPPWTVKVAYDRIASEDKTFVMLGKGWGTRHEYGHGDLVVGRFARLEVFPRVRDWLPP